MHLSGAENVKRKKEVNYRKTFWYNATPSFSLYRQGALFMPKAFPGPFEQCGRLITTEEIKEIIATIETFPRLSISTLTETICEHLNWFTATGTYKKDACLKLLEKLEAKGVLKLPEKRAKSHNTVTQAKKIPSDVTSDLTRKRTEIKCNLRDIAPVKVRPASSKSDIKLFNDHISQYHYLGYKRPFGCFMRYFAKSADGEIIACILFSGAAKSMTVRDKWIGWSTNQRLRNLAWVTNNSRFTIMPWVKIPCLASHILGQIGRRIVGDWQAKWGYSPLLLETFVDPLRYSGTCYKASNWEYLGQTTGKGLVRQGKSYTTSPKLIFVKPLAKNFRKQLCKEYLEGYVDDI